MRVMQAEEFGGPQVLVPRKEPDPAPGAGQIVVRVDAADVLFVDVIVRYGLGVDFFPIRPPYVPGNGVSGQVSAVGKVSNPGWVGRAVVAHTGPSGGAGGYAEQAVVAAEDLIAVPDGVRPREAGALLHDGVTALSLLERVTVRPGDQMLVTAAGGGMGILLLQFVRAAGARAIGAARGGHKLEVVLNEGADAVDYSEPGWTDRVRDLTKGHGVDVVFDGAGGALGTAAFELLADGGRFSAHGMSDGGFAGIDREAADRRGIGVIGIEEGPLSP